MARFAVGVCLSVLVVSSALAQIDPAAGVQMFSTNNFGVDLASSNINIRIPIRDKLGISISLVLNSHMYGIYGGPGSQPPYVWAYPWGPQTSFVVDLAGAVQGFGYSHLQTLQNACNSGNSPDYVWSNFYVIDETGAQHRTNNPATDQCGQYPATSIGTTLDGSGFTLIATGGGGVGEAQPAGTVYNKSGVAELGMRAVNGGWTAISDPDGNMITPTSSGIQDPLGQIVINGSGDGNFLAPGTYTYSYTDVSQNTQSYTVLTQQYTWATAFGCSNAPDFVNTSAVYLPYQINTPGGSSYQIQYEQTPGHSGNGQFGQYTTGRVAKIIYPTGGSISYGYGGLNNGINCTSFVAPTLTVTVDDNNGNAGTWTYLNSNNSSVPGNFTVTETDPAGNQKIHYFAGEYETQMVAKQGTSTVLETVTTCYGSNGSTPPTPPHCASPTTVPTLPITETDVYTSFGTSATNLVTTRYDSTYGNVTAMLAYDFGPGSVLSQTYFYYGKSWNGGSCNLYPTGTYIFNTPCYTETDNSSGSPLAETKVVYNNDGKPASVSKWTGAAENTWLTTSFGYGANGASAGVLSSVTEPNTAVTTFTSFECNGMLSTATRYPLSSVGSDSQTWDCNGGVKTSYTDVNGHPTTYSYTANGADPLYRIKSVTHADGGVVSFAYSAGSSLPWTTTTSTAISSSSSTISSIATLDGLGRTVSTQSTDPNPSGGNRYTSTVYNNLGQVVKSYNPYFTSGDPTYGYTSFIYDGLGRIISTTAPDRSSTSTVTYTNRAALFTDPSGIQQSAQVDGMGRIVLTCTGIGAGNQANNQYGYGAPTSCGLDVTEANGFPATNAYDALGNLTSMSISGQVRSFKYDGLGRKTAEYSPEVPAFPTGWCGGFSACYVYDTVKAGDLATRTAYNPAGGAPNAQYTWDLMHRLTLLEYSDGTSGYGYVYDASSWSGQPLANGIGRLTSESHANGAASAMSYDPMGRLASETSCAGTNCYGTLRTIAYTYDYAGDITSITDANATRVANTYNSIGQLAQTTSSWQDNYHPAVLWTAAAVTPYNALGKLAKATYGDGLVRTNTYDKDGRLTEISDGTGPTYRLFLTYNPNNTLSVYQDNVTGRWNYSYDAFNRLATAVATQTGNPNAPNYSYTYDQFGNRWTQTLNAGVGNPMSDSFDTTAPYTTIPHNKNSKFNYDSAGNITVDGACNLIYPTPCWTYDYAGHMTSSSSGASYLYDALGRRQQKTDAAGVHSFVLGPDGQPFDEYVGSMWTRTTAELFTYANSTTYFNHTDERGTPKLSTDYTGTVQRTEDSLDNIMGPFGDNFTETGAFIDYTGFAGGFWDVENVGNHFGAREYEPLHGSWRSPDPAGMAAVDMTNPQSWNRYAYVMYDPVNLTDPLGLDPLCVWDNRVHDCPALDGTASKEVGECTIDGVVAPCNLAFRLVRAGAAAECPGGDCVFNDRGLFQHQWTQDDGWTWNRIPISVFSPASTATISAYHPSVSTCLGQAAISAGEDLLGVSMLPGSDQDNWQWSRGKFGFVYTGGGEVMESSVGLDAVEKMADFVAATPAAQGDIRQFLRSEGVKVSLKHVSKDAATVGKWAGRAGKVLAAYSAYERYQKCRGD